jgi:signal transduction histidine kinase
MLPDADGLAVLRRLRSLPELRDTKIIMLTAHFDENVKIEALQRGADDFLSKPFGVTEVRARVAHLIRSSRLQAALRAEREELRRSLEKLAATESQLFHSEKMRAIASLAAGLLHEINNPVHYALMATRALRQDLAQQRDPSETIDDIEEGIGRIAEIVSDLRAFAYPQEENVQKAFPLGEAVITALRFAAHEAHGIRLEADDAARGTLPVVGSRSQITQVLLNLVLNSVSALRTAPVGGDPVVTIRAVRKGDRVEVTVRDNGPGIPAEIQPRVMEPFFTTSEPGQGIGLGLSICHTIVNSHGGQLVLDSTLQDGTHITFDLPLLSESASS